MPVMWWFSLGEMVFQLYRETLGITGEYGVELHFLTSAVELGIEVIELESLQLQMEIFFDIPTEVLIYEIKQLVLILEGYAESDSTGFLHLYDAWKNGDEQRIELLLFENIPETYRDEYIYLMLTHRDIAMAERLRHLMSEEKKVFVAVGTGHLIGEGSFIHLLRQAGYDVVRIYR